MNINYCLIAHPRSGSTYLRFIISFLLKTHAMQPNHNNDPTFKNWPLNTENKNKIHFRKYHTVKEFIDNKKHLLNKGENTKFIINIRNPILNIKANCKYDNKFPENLEKTQHYKNYWNNIRFIDNCKEDILVLSFHNLTSKDKNLHYQEINKMIDFFDLDKNEIQNYDYEKIQSLSKKTYKPKKDIPTWFNQNEIYNSCIQEIQTLKNQNLKNILLYELNREPSKQ